MAREIGESIKAGNTLGASRFLELEPPQAEVIEKILKHCGLWQDPASRAPPDTDGLTRNLDFGFSTKRNAQPETDQAQEVTYVDIDTFLATF